MAFILLALLVNGIRWFGGGLVMCYSLSDMQVISFVGVFVGAFAVLIGSWF